MNTQNLVKFYLVYDGCLSVSDFEKAFTELAATERLVREQAPTDRLLLRATLENSMKLVLAL